MRVKYKIGMAIFLVTVMLFSMIPMLSVVAEEKRHLCLMIKYLCLSIQIKYY